MTTLNREKLDALIDEIKMWASKCEEMEAQMKSATGEVSQAYALVHRDYMWKIQNKIGRLWYYVCGCAEMSPFEEVAKACEEAVKAEASEE